MDTFAVSLLFFSVIIVAIVVIFIKPGDKLIRFLLTFSGAFLLSLAFTKIIPSIFGNSHIEGLGYFVLLGFFIQIFVDYLSGGAEHGHIHGHNDINSHNHDEHHSDCHKGSGVVINPLALLIGISLHAFFEGMPFVEIQHESDHLHESLLAGVILHKVPIAIVLMTMFLNSGYSRLKSFILISIFAIAAPLGSFVSSLFIGHAEDMTTYYQIVMALVVGIFFHIATVILMESDKDHKFNIVKLATILLGVGTAIVAVH